MWSCVTRSLLVVVAVVIASSTVDQTTFIYLRMYAEPNDTYKVFSVASCTQCALWCQNLGCRVWSWTPEGQVCSFHRNFKADTFSSPPTSKQTYLASVRYQGALYVGLEVGKQNWTQARDLCLKVDGILIFSEDLTWVRSVKAFYGVSGFFLGLEQDPNNLELWIDQTGRIFENSSMQWGPNEPTGGQACAATWYTLSDVPCHSRYTHASLCRIRG